MGARNVKASDSNTHKTIETLARFGYLAKGVVYALVGVLAALAAAGLGGRATGTKGAINALAGQPFGQFLLVALALGLAGYVVWRCVQGVWDPEGKGGGVKGLGARAGLLLSGLIYGALAVYTVSLLIAAGTAGSSARDRTATLMSYAGGIWLVAAIGAGFIGVALYHAWRVRTDSFRDAWDQAAMSTHQQAWATRVARIGIAARAFVFVIIGVLLITAAWQADPSEARGLGGALNALAAQPFGPWLLGVVGLGLFCYGLYCFVNARFRHINP